MDMVTFMDTMRSAFPYASVDLDNEGQLVVYTGLQYLTSTDNPSIPAGEHIIQPFVPDCGDPGPDCEIHSGECD